MRSLPVLVFIMVTELVGAGARHGARLESRPHGAPAAYGAGGVDELELNLSYLKGYISDAGGVLKSPLSWRASDWLKFSFVVAATWAISSEEDDLQGWAQHRRNDDTNMVSQFTRPAGSGKYVLPALGLLYGAGRIAGSSRATRTALLGLESGVISGAFSGTIKYLTHKERPGDSTIDEAPWNGPGLYHDHLSFPSGHSACGFALATIVAADYGDYALVRPLAYCAAALAALSRVSDNAHWVSDILLGSAIGHFTARTIAARHGRVAGSGFRILPMARAGGVGLTVA